MPVMRTRLAACIKMHNSACVGRYICGHRLFMNSNLRVFETLQHTRLQKNTNLTFLMLDFLIFFFDWKSLTIIISYSLFLFFIVLYCNKIFIVKIISPMQRWRVLLWKNEKKLKEKTSSILSFRKVNINESDKQKK